MILSPKLLHFRFKFPKLKTTVNVNRDIVPFWHILLTPKTRTTTPESTRWVKPLNSIISGLDINLRKKCSADVFNWNKNILRWKPMKNKETYCFSPHFWLTDELENGKKKTIFCFLTNLAILNKSSLIKL